jgi:GNAT superfamily N-acetyltransferase
MTRPPVLYRNFRSASDTDAVIDLLHALNRHEAALGALRDPARRGARACLDEDSDKIREWGGEQIVALVDQQVVGYIALTLGKAGAFVPEDVREQVFVENLVVAEPRRGQGIGHALLAHAEDLARLHGFRAICLGLVPGNEGAEHLYRRAGFSPTAIEMRRIID